jgi:hypothetical protein
MNRPARMLTRCARWVVPAARRDWVEAVWAEAPDVPPGLRRLAWRAGGVRLIAREALMRRGVVSAALFAAAAAAAAWVAWPSSSVSVDAPVDRVHVITVVSLLAGLPLLTRPFLGPVAGNRAARYLRGCTYLALLALIPAYTAVQQFDTTRPRGTTDQRLFELVAHPGAAPQWGGEILVLAVMAIYAAAIVWMTSRRAGVAGTTLAIGSGAGLALGAVMYAVAPLGLSRDATNPWLPGSDIDPLVLLAWALLLGGPVTAGIIADRRYPASNSSSRPAGARIRQVLAAGVLTSMSGALIVATLGTGTVAVMVKAAWLRNWLYHGHHLLYGVQNLSVDLKTLPAIAYSHQITGAVDASVLVAICLIFPVIALFFTVVPAVGVWEYRTDGDTGRPGGGGPRGPMPAPDSAEPVRLTDIGADGLMTSSPPALGEAA